MAEMKPITIKVVPDYSDVTNPVMKYFKYDHLQGELQDVSKLVAVTAHAVNQCLPNGPEKSAGLRKLLEAKDCFVRAMIND